MIKASIEGKVSLNCTKEFFIKKIKEIFANLGGKGFYKTETLSPDTIKITSDKFLYRKININRIVFKTESENGKIAVSYHADFSKWFTAMLFLSFTLLIAFVIFFFFFNAKYSATMETSHYVIIFGSVFFWAFMWPIIMTFFYKSMIKNFVERILALIEAQYMVLKQNHSR